MRATHLADAFAVRNAAIPATVMLRRSRAWLSWACLRGSAGQAADMIQAFVEEAGEPRALLARLSAPEHALAGDPDAAAALAEMGTLFELLGAMGGGVLGRLRFDLSLARGLDYYTGLIYEAVLVRGPAEGGGSDGAPECNVGSIAAGGRRAQILFFSMLSFSIDDASS